MAGQMVLVAFDGQNGPGGRRGDRARIQGGELGALVPLRGLWHKEGLARPLLW